MYTRLLERPDCSFFLFGPRGTGKSTWIRNNYQDAVLYDLLNTGESLRLSREPGLIYREVADLETGSWVVIDEIQKVPELLNEVHRLIEDRGLRFVLSGSSARKLRRGGSNLLAGRALVEYMFPLTFAEVGFSRGVDDMLSAGSLPLAVTGADAAAYLSAYAETYLQEEVRAEALTRNIGAFSRFLEIAGRQNGQVTNLSGIARDAAVARATVQNYFEILEDTLLGYWLTPWKLKRATKQVAHPKFYFFDCGVARALSGRMAYPPSPEEQGVLLETWLLNEIRAYLSYRHLRYPMHFWRSHDGVEVDFICETAKGFVAVEIKASTRWEKRYHRGLKRMQAELSGSPVKTYGVYAGEKQATWDGVSLLPVHVFLKELWADRIITDR